MQTVDDAERAAEEKRIARMEARDDVGFAVRALASNLMRVTRGAGKPYDIIRDCAEFITAMEKHWELCNQYPSNLETMLRLDYDNSSFGHSEETMVRGALQIAASKLIGQSTQEAAGKTELHRGIEQREHERDARRREHAQGRY